jgi:hypothetical protein
VVLEPSCDGNGIGDGIVLRWQRHRRWNRPAMATRNGVILEWWDRSIPILAEESMVCCRGSKLEMMYSHPTAIAVSVAAGAGDPIIPTLPKESMLSPTVCKLEMIYSHPTTTVVSGLPEPDQSIPMLAVESMLYSRGCKAEMISPYSVERLLLLSGRSVSNNEFEKQPPTQHSVFCGVRVSSRCTHCCI